MVLLVYTRRRFSCSSLLPHTTSVLQLPTWEGLGFLLSLCSILSTYREVSIIVKICDLGWGSVHHFNPIFSRFDFCPLPFLESMECVHEDFCGGSHAFLFSNRSLQFCQVDNLFCKKKRKQMCMCYFVDFAHTHTHPKSPKLEKFNPREGDLFIKVTQGVWG